MIPGEVHGTAGRVLCYLSGFAAGTGVAGIAEWGCSGGARKTPTLHTYMH